MIRTPSELYKEITHLCAENEKLRAENERIQRERDDIERQARESGYHNEQMREKDRAEIERQKERATKAEMDNGNLRHECVVLRSGLEREQIEAKRLRARVAEYEPAESVALALALARVLEIWRQAESGRINPVEAQASWIEAILDLSRQYQGDSARRRG